MQGVYGIFSDGEREGGVGEDAAEWIRGAIGYKDGNAARIDSIEKSCRPAAVKIQSLAEVLIL